MKEVISDTTDFSRIDRNDILKLDNKLYRIIGDTKEGRFGLEDPKYWVKKAVDMQTKERKIIKLVFYEEFQSKIGDVLIDCFRSPLKEAQILKLVEGHPGFMHGWSTEDSAGNNVRILDMVRGKNFYNHVEDIQVGHEQYFFEYFPKILKKLARAFQSIKFLHNNGFRHGDVRNDHIFVERGTGNYVWIDFDYEYNSPEHPFGFDLFGMGNVLLYALGKGFHLYYNIVNDPKYGDLKDNIDPGHFSLLDPSRYLNLRKIYPYIPEMFNRIIMSFAKNSEFYYDTTEELMDDINRCIYTMEWKMDR